MDIHGRHFIEAPADLLEASGHCADALRLTRAEYMQRAREEMNRDALPIRRYNHANLAPDDPDV